MSVTILIADDHPLLLNGTKEFLERKNYQVLATATDGNEAYNKIIKHQPDIALLDFDMPKQNGLEVAQALKRKNIPTYTIILTLHKEESLIQEVGKSIVGYMTKDTALDELEVCLKAIIQGKNYIGSSLQHTVHFDMPNHAISSLSVTEIKILRYIEKDMTSTQIAEELFISKRTVDKHRSNIIEKLNLSSKANALVLWIKQHPEVFD